MCEAMGKLAFYWLSELEVFHADLRMGLTLDMICSYVLDDLAIETSEASIRVPIGGGFDLCGGASQGHRLIR